MVTSLTILGFVAACFAGHQPMRTEGHVEGSRVLAQGRPGGVAGGAGAVPGRRRGDVQRGGCGLPERGGVAAGALADGGDVTHAKPCFRSSGGPLFVLFRCLFLALRFERTPRWWR